MRSTVRRTVRRVAFWLGVAAAVIAVFSFVTGHQSLPLLLSLWRSKHPSATVFPSSPPSTWPAETAPGTATKRPDEIGRDAARGATARALPGGRRTQNVLCGGFDFVPGAARVIDGVNSGDYSGTVRGVVDWRDVRTHVVLYSGAVHCPVDALSTASCVDMTGCPAEPWLHDDCIQIYNESARGKKPSHFWSATPLAAPLLVVLNDGPFRTQGIVQMDVTSEGEPPQGGPTCAPLPKPWY